MLNDMSLNRDYERRKPDEDILKTQAELFANGNEGDGSMKTFGEPSRIDEAFHPFPKVPRLMRPVVVTEKIDGTNASVRVYSDGTVRAGSRKRWITPEDDNFGFAAWVRDHAEELRGLGEGHHFGEWWGRGIQRGYGLQERRFSLFNVDRWSADSPPPACCHVVPVLRCFSDIEQFVCGATNLFLGLALEGSRAAPGYMDVEGVMVWHTAARQMFKYTLDNDGHKGA